MRNLINDALKDHGADYVEIRVEESDRTAVSYRGRDLDSISRLSGFGGNVRAAVNGGWGFVSFNTLDNLKDKVKLAVLQAKLVGKDKTQLAPVEPVVDEVRPAIIKDPRTVSLSDKKKLVEEYAEVILSLGDKIQTCFVNYSDTWNKIYYANTDGTWIDSERVYVVGSTQAVARMGDDIQQNTSSVSSTQDYGVFEDRHSDVKKMGEAAIEMLSAPRINGGSYTVIVDPSLAGIFAHEAFGHLSEADDMAENQQMRDLMVLGRRFGGKHLNILDGADIPGSGGTIKYDNEGVLKKPTYLVKEGVLVGRLHSRESAAKMGEEPTGNARALNYTFPPIVRMTNTYVAPSKDVTMEDILSDVDEGLYVIDSLGGQTSGEMFTFSAREAFMIRKGKIAERVRGVNLTGNVFTTLENIDAIGNDIVWPKKGGGCGKGGQSPLPVGFAGPHFRIRNCVVGGK
ncbi:MAG: TldD/PmbA family protein [Armatimonadota bacterium]